MMDKLIIAFSVLMLATLFMFGMGAKGMVVSVARPVGGKIRKGASVTTGIIFMLIGFLFSMVSFSIVIPSFGNAATVISTLALCLVSAAVQVKLGLSKKSAVAVAVAVADTANAEAMAAVTSVEPTITTQDVAAQPASVAPAVVPAAVATAAAVSSTVAPATLAANDDASDELDDWADSQDEIPAVAPAVQLAKVTATPDVIASTTSADIAELTEVVAPAAAVAAVAPAAPQLDLVDAALLSEQYEAFDPANRHFQSVHDEAYEELIANMYPHDASHVA
jgi:hypothetical protein